MSCSTFNSFQKNGSKLGGHPSRDIMQGITFSTGSLGLGISHAVGQALFLKSKYPSNTPFVSCIIGDGESVEGIVHESLNLASFHSLSNLLIFLDNNKFQQTGSTSNISNPIDWESYCKSLNINYINILDGHDHDQLLPMIMKASKVNSSKHPYFFNCNTIKGYGCPSLSDSNSGHYTTLTPDQLADFSSMYSL